MIGRTHAVKPKFAASLPGVGFVKRRRVLIIVENLTVPLDRRVWQEATSLRDAGYTVSVICPKGGAYVAPYELLEGIHIFRHPMPLEADGAAGYAVEYASALFWEFVLSVKAYFKVGFDAIQACNPPDLIFVVGGFWKYLFGKRFVFDHHDINPELFEAKFGKRGFFHSVLQRLERMTFAVADVSIATNETFKSIAVERGGMAADDVFIVRSIPNLEKFHRVAADESLKAGRKCLVGYVGVMGAQDGVDLLVDAMAEIVNRHGRQDVHCAIVGSGTELEALKARAWARGLEDHITFTGFLTGERLLEAFSTFDVGVIPDPKNAYNDKISMNKLFEYMVLGLPFVQFDLIEGRRTAGDAALYAGSNCPAGLARQILRLVDDDDLRSALSQRGLARAERMLQWPEERRRLLAAYDRVLGHDGASVAAEPEHRPATAGGVKVAPLG
jgi:glycosyltransferase involved in cell wall biosynthesis